MTATTHRQERDGSRPSGKRSTESVVSASPTATGQTPSQPHQVPLPGAGEWPTWRPRNMTASTVPVAMKSTPSRCPGRWNRT